MDIYSLNDKLIDTLFKDKSITSTSKTFNECKANADKVKYIEELLRLYDFVPKSDPCRTKDNKTAKELRQEGNVLFGKGKASDALELYNQSICWADCKDSSEELAIGYANRSAVYHKWQMYEMCCENIELAKKAGYPERLMEKLMKRETDCLDHINNENDLKSDESNYIPKLDIQANSRIPFIANCLEMKQDPDQGRCVITNVELNPGEVFAIEEPYAVALQPISRYHRCANCLVENSLSIIPCPSCTNAMFCSQKCLTQAYKEYHQFECPISDSLLILFNKIHMSALRVTLKAINSLDSVNKMIEFCKENENSNVTKFSFDHTNGLSPLQSYQQIHCLATNQDKRKPSDLFQRATIAAMLYHLLMKHTKLVNVLTNSDSQAAFIEILYRHLQTSPTNFHTLCLAETPSMEGIDYANGAYPFCSLLNHSCAPNICRMSIGRKMMVFALRVIKQGEQLFDNYGYHHCLMSKESRQSSLNSQYNFLCNCSACCFDYSTILELPLVPNVPHIHSDDDIKKLTELDLKFATQNLKRFCQFLKEFDDYYPCKQISEAQENLKMCFHILVQNYSFQTKTEKFNLNKN